MSIDHLHYNGRPGPVEPLAPPSGAILLSRPVRLKLGGWIEMDYDARYDLDGITWVRAKGGFGDGQRTGWHPREDWVAVLPALSLHVGRYFNKPHVWDPSAKYDSIQSAMRGEVADKLSYSRFPLREARGRVTALERAVRVLEASRARVWA